MTLLFLHVLRSKDNWCNNANCCHQVQRIYILFMILDGCIWCTERRPLQLSGHVFWFIRCIWFLLLVFRTPYTYIENTMHANSLNIVWLHAPVSAVRFSNGADISCVCVVCVCFYLTQRTSLPLSITHTYRLCLLSAHSFSDWLPTRTALNNRFVWNDRQSHSNRTRIPQHSEIAQTSEQKVNRLQVSIHSVYYLKLLHCRSNNHSLDEKIIRMVNRFAKLLLSSSDISFIVDFASLWISRTLRTERFWLYSLWKILSQLPPSNMIAEKMLFFAATAFSWPLFLTQH